VIDAKVHVARHIERHSRFGSKSWHFEGRRSAVHGRVQAGMAPIAALELLSHKGSFVKLRLSDIQSVSRRKMTLSDTGSRLLSFKGGM
jgi:hypothetical protein